MGWRDFQATASMEFMENMELITPEPSLIPLIPFIPPIGLSENGGAPALPTFAEIYRPKPKVWLVNGALRTSGHIDDLAGAIIELTADDMEQQKTLLLLHCECYDRHHNKPLPTIAPSCMA